MAFHKFTHTPPPPPPILQTDDGTGLDTPYCLTMLHMSATTQPIYHYLHEASVRYLPIPASYHLITIYIRSVNDTFLHV